MALLNVGVVGAGGISGVHIQAWQHLGATVSVHSQAGAEEAAARHGVTTTGSLEELIASCDVVDICTPTPTHPAIANQAIAAGRNVVCEKPLARTAVEARAVAAAADAAGVQLYPGHVVRYFPAYQAMREVVRRGDLGELAVCRFTRMSASPASPWFADEAASGGIVMDQMIHDLDFARWIAGDVESVYAVKSSGGEVAVTAHVTLTHAGGAISQVVGLWGPPSLTFRTSFDVAGRSGVLRYDSAEDRALVTDLGADPTAGTPLPDISMTESPYLSEIREFAAAFAGGPAPRVSASDGVYAVGLAEAALASLASGEPEGVRP